MIVELYRDMKINEILMHREVPPRRDISSKLFKLGVEDALKNYIGRIRELISVEEK